MSEPFVHENSIVRKIWGQSDTILFIFAGGAAEFALNKAVDWLYYTGRLPADPIGRLFSTVKYARRIVFAPKEEANHAIATMAHIHVQLEKDRGYAIPDWAYRDVLYMLIYYSIQAFELLERKLSDEEKESVYDVFYRVGKGMGLSSLPADYNSWLSDRERHLQEDLQRSAYTDDLFRQYRRQLGNTRYKILIEAQKLVVPPRVLECLHFNSFQFLRPTVPLYRLIKRIGLAGLVRAVLLPAEYKEKIRALDLVEN